MPYFTDTLYVLSNYNYIKFYKINQGRKYLACTQAASALALRGPFAMVLSAKTLLSATVTPTLLQHIGIYRFLAKSTCFVLQ